MADYKMGARKKSQRQRRSRIAAYGNLRNGITNAANLPQLRAAALILLDYAQTLEFRIQKIQRRIDDD